MDWMLTQHIERKLKNFYSKTLNQGPLRAPEGPKNPNLPVVMEYRHVVYQNRSQGKHKSLGHSKYIFFGQGQPRTPLRVP